MANQFELNTDLKLSKSAFRVYGALALLVYVLALTYCYVTSHFFEMGMVAVVVLLLAGLARIVYRKL